MNRDPNQLTHPRDTVETPTTLEASIRRIAIMEIEGAAPVLAGVSIAEPFDFDVESLGL